MEEIHQGLAWCILQSGSQSLGDSGRAEGEELRPRRSSQPGAPTPGGSLRGDIRHRPVCALFRVLQAPGHYGNDTSRNAGAPICRVSQRRRNESYSLSPPGLPCTDISCGFLLRLFL